jgi:hypothetical protein
MKISKVCGKDIKRFTKTGGNARKNITSRVHEEEEKKEDANLENFAQLHSSQIQQFNSFSTSTARISQTIGHTSANTENNGINRSDCCHCKKSHCLQLYCECFARNSYCSGCTCQLCMNNEANEEERGKAIQETLARNPTAFTPKIICDTTSPVIFDISFFVGR